jgi:hypothetical protein
MLLGGDPVAQPAFGRRGGDAADGGGRDVGRGDAPAERGELQRVAAVRAA